LDRRDFQPGQGTGSGAESAGVSYRDKLNSCHVEHDFERAAIRELPRRCRAVENTSCLNANTESIRRSASRGSAMRCAATPVTTSTSSALKFLNLGRTSIRNLARKERSRQPTGRSNPKRRDFAFLNTKREMTENPARSARLGPAITHEP